MSVLPGKDEPIIPEILDNSEIPGDLLRDKRRALVKIGLLSGKQPLEIAEEAWKRQLVPSATFDQCRTLIRQDIGRIINQLKPEDAERIERARTTYVLRKEKIYREAMSSADSAKGMAKAAFLKLAGDTAKDIARVQGVDTERPLKIQDQGVVWSVEIRDDGNAAGQPRQIGEGEDDAGLNTESGDSDAGGEVQPSESPVVQHGEQRSDIDA